MKLKKKLKTRTETTRALCAIYYCKIPDSKKNNKVAKIFKEFSIAGFISKANSMRMTYHCHQ